ncbi:sugar phosphate isomerase/epimerase [Alsobacter sp. SYSU M60028]|uniref:Sugar phosphate isomerase/epimerase n=1 Tax=Alsobacter ponti TaxID=2962936 RepID=A0ABT1LDL9_9HYPH|nr:sugar phosphate isomerase/epimerase family protein [Alsobacter ponti]MCP8938328.1 sugar phosphate isomerase/epimerase [Alsobacter ponti]
MRLGFSTIACPNAGIDEVIALARSSGLEGIEIRFLHGTVDLASLPELAPSRLGETRRRFEDAGLKVVVIGSGVRMNALDPEVRDKQKEAARVNASIAAGLGAPYMRVFGGPLPPAQDREATLDAIALGLGEVAAITAEHGVESILETHDDFSTSASVLDLYRRGCDERLAVLWDTLHTHRHGEMARDTWAALGPRIRHVHVKDSYKADRSGFDFALTGEGSVPIASFFEVLKAAGYAGFVHFEWEKGWHPEIADADIAVPHFARVARELGA